MVLFGGTSVYYRKHSYILWWTKLSVYSFVSVSNNMDYLLYIAVFLPQETEERRGNILKSIFLFLFGLISSWLILGVITGDYGIKNMLFLIIAYLGAKFAIRQRKK
ncbi:hypothetical protein [Psychrobacillus sp. FSL H8-0487]|uniref:hypothetical protein n=1 Tax=Psychrobacillus sp. FSL H8-0487 TaxID=2921391 RepID=UPI0030FAF759